MASKLFIICALACVIQGLNAAVFVRPERESASNIETGLFRETFDYFQNLEKEYGSIIDRFENVIVNTEAEGPEAEFSGPFENVMSPLEEFASVEMNEEAAGNNIIRECIRAERKNFQKLAMQIRQRVIDAAAELRQFISETLGPYLQRAREAFRAMGETIALFPARMWECMLEGNVMKAIEVVRQTRTVVTTNANIIGKNLREARSKFPLIREKAKQMREQIRKEAAAGMRVIRENIRKCIINGGPKPILPAAVPEQTPVTQDISLVAPAVPAVPAAPADQVSTLVAPEEQVSTLVAPADAVISQSE